METPWRKLEDKVVLVTGASAGLGRELCLDLVKAGCRVVAAARRTDRLLSLCDEVNGTWPMLSFATASAGVHAADAGVKAVAVKLDVSADEESIETAVRRAWSAFGRIDVLINNAGVRGGVYSILEWPEEEANSVINTNQSGLWLVSKHVCRLMRAAKLKGNVINVSSISALRPSKGSLPYSTSKEAVNAMTKCMALELGENGIRVNSICLGLFKSEITKGLMEKDWLTTVANKSVPLRTWGTSDPAFTSLVRYLIHSSSQYVTGNMFVVDCGYNLPGVPIYSSL